jgi:hypothetical protein
MEHAEGSTLTRPSLSPERADGRHGKKRRAQHVPSLRKPVEVHRASRPPPPAQLP